MNKIEQRRWLILFEELGLLGNALILLASLVIIDKASDWTILNSVRVADITGFGKTTIGFILVAFSTSLPELCVSIFAAIGGENIGIAIGNVLGSNIVNICFILGICFLIVTLKSSEIIELAVVMTGEEIGTLYSGLFWASIIPLAILYIGYASRIIGIILLSIFVFYVYRLSKTRNIRDEGALGDERRRLPKYAFFTILGAVLVVASSYFIVDSASNIAEDLGIPKIVIGATVVAFGTSLPELTTSISSIRRGHIDLTLGNIIGSCFINITCILGVALMSATLSINMAAFSNLVMFSLIVNLLLWYFLSGERIGWREGAMLLFLYLVFLIVSFGGYRT